MRNLLLLAVAASATLSASAVLACSCAPYRSAAEQLEATDLVFRGRVSGAVRTDEWTRRTTFRVAEVLKGRAARTITVEHQTSSAACGLTYRRGETVWVFATRRGNGPWRTSLCSTARFPIEDYRRAARGEPVPTSPPVF